MLTGKFGRIVRDAAVREDRIEALQGFLGLFLAVVAGHNLVGQFFLGLFGMQTAFLDGFLEFRDLFQRLAGNEFVETPHEFIGNGHGLTELIGGGLVDADVVSVRFRHLAHAVKPFEQRHRENALRLQIVLGHERTSHEQVEGLVGAAKLHVRLERNGVVALHEGIQEFVQGDGRILAVAFGEVVAFHHAGQRVARGEADEVGGGKIVEPAGVEFHVFSGSRILKTCFL